MSRQTVMDFVILFVLLGVVIAIPVSIGLGIFWLLTNLGN